MSISTMEVLLMESESHSLISIHLNVDTWICTIISYNSLNGEFHFRIYMLPAQKHWIFLFLFNNKKMQKLQNLSMKLILFLITTFKFNHMLIFAQYRLHNIKVDIDHFWKRNRTNLSHLWRKINCTWHRTNICIV